MIHCTPTSKLSMSLPRRSLLLIRAKVTRISSVSFVSASIQSTTRTETLSLSPRIAPFMFRRVMSSMTPIGILQSNQQQQVHQQHDSTKSATNAVAVDDIEELHERACLNHENTYVDPAAGFTVFTKLFHLQRGNCCGNECRHCPYNHMNTKKNKQRIRHDVDDDDSSTSSSGDDNALNHHSSLLSSSLPDDDNSAIASAMNNHSNNKKTGGRYGGNYTAKNVVYTRRGDMGTSQLFTGERRYKNDIIFDALGTVDELCSIVGVCYAEINHSIQGIQNDGIMRDSKDDDTTTINKNEILTRELMTKTNQDLEQVQEWLLEIMSRLFDIGSHIAKPSRKLKQDDANLEKSDGTMPTKFDMTNHIQQLELWIDIMTEALPELTSFLLPTGSIPSAQLHVARTVCRRTERTIVPLIVDTVVDHSNSNEGGIDGSTTGGCDPTTLAYINRLSDFFFTAARYVNDRLRIPDIAYQRPTTKSNVHNRLGSEQHQRTRVVLDYTKSSK